jgi:hypothetical protein
VAVRSMHLRRVAATTAVLGLAGSVVVAGSLAMPSGKAAAASQWTGAQLLQPYQAGPDFSEYQVMSFSTPAEESVAIWSDGQRSLLSASRSRDASNWSTPTTIASDGEFVWHYIQGTDPAAAMAPNGDITVAWTSWQLNRIEVTTRHAGAWSAPTTITTGSQIGDAHIGYGADGSGALVWTDGSTVFASLRPAGSAWSAPVTVSDPVVVDPADSTPLPLLQDPRVAVGTDGRVVVTWGAYDGQANNLGKFYRIRASALPAGGSSWTAPEWVSLPSEVVYEPQLQPAGDGSLMEVWVANDATNSDRLRWSRLDGSGWSTPGDLGTRNQASASLAFGPGGSVTAEWLGYAATSPYGSELRVASYRPDTGWSPTAVLASQVDMPHLVAAANGTPTAGWRSCTFLGATPNCTLQLSTLTGGAWSAPASAPTVDTGLTSYELSSSPSGQLNVVYDDEVPNLAHLHGKYQIQAAGTIQPQLSATAAPSVKGSATVGGLLTAATGTWAQPPSSFTFQWWRNGIAIPTAAHQTYRPGLADAGNRLSVTVAGHLAGYRDAVARSAQVTVARPPLRNLVRPSITGTARVGQVLLSHVGSWTPTPAGYGYQWLRDGRAIPGATRYAYRLGTADRGHAIAVRVTAVRSPYLSTSSGSWPVRPR